MSNNNLTLSQKQAIETRKAWNANIKMIAEKTINGVTLTCKRRIRENQYGMSGGSLGRAWFATIEEARENWKLRASKIPS